MPNIQNTQAQSDVPVIYIGNKAQKRDSTFNSRRTFLRGVPQIIVSSIADHMLRVKDVYTTYGTPELEAFCKANPQLAIENKLTVLSAEELNAQVTPAPATLGQQTGTTADDKKQDASPPAPTGNSENEMLLESAREEIAAAPNKPAIIEWAENNNLQLSVDAKAGRSELEAAALDAYSAQIINA